MQKLWRKKKKMIDLDPLPYYLTRGKGPTESQLIRLIGVSPLIGVEPVHKLRKDGERHDQKYEPPFFIKEVPEELKEEGKGDSVDYWV